MLLRSDDKKRRLEDRAGEVESVVAAGTKFKGTISGQAGVRISGSLEGDISSQQLVWVEKKGRVDGNIRSPFVIVEGELNGNIESAEHVELRTEGRVIGNIETVIIAMAEGCVFNGEILMRGKESKSITFVERRTGGGREGNPDQSLPS
jgi:cytoskeletal protein CcmA (bactofilin family)